jgi:dTDP-4-amino-4,6-dideoxygalactose transaminase
MIPRRRTAIDGWSFVDSGLHASTGDIAAFEADFAARVGRRHAVAACSGRTALVAILLASGLRPDDEVILPALTLLDLPRLLEHHGWRPVYVDVDPDTMLMDPEGVRAAITPRTRAVLPTDLFGNAADWQALLGADARAAGATVVEDAAHAAGSTLGGQQVGERSDVAFFSLETIKMLHAFGGGVAVTDDAALALRIRAALPTGAPAASRLPMKFLRNTVENLGFRTPAYGLALAALDAPSLQRPLLAAYERVRQGSVATATAWTDWQARFARRQLDGLDARVVRQRRVAQRIIDGVGNLVAFQREPAGVASNRYFLVGTLAAAPLGLRRAMLRHRIDIGMGSELVDFCPPRAHAARFPHARHIHEHMIQLPLHADLDDRDADRIIAALIRELRT